MYRVVVADDEPIERMVITKTIQKYFAEQLEVITAVNGREAVEKYFSGQCQIALLDIEMPGINGLEAAEKIREQDKDGSIVFLTAFDEFGYAKRAISVRALEYLLKPCADEELIAVLEEAIRIADEKAERQSAEEKPERRAETGAAAYESSRQTESDSVAELRMNVVAESIRSYIETNYMEDISLQTAAEYMNYSDAYFCKIFKQCFDKNFIVYLSEYRIEKAKRLLSDVTINVKDVSQKVGYRDANYFAKVFKRMMGTTPTEYRMQVLREEKG